MIEESLLTEASNYKPKFKTKDWEGALKELNKGAAGNYSQLKGLESVTDQYYYETADQWVEEFYSGGDFDPDHKFKDIVSDIANFFAAYYSCRSYDYCDSRESIYYAKRDMEAEDFGVEMENWYNFYEYSGPSNLKKYAKMIAAAGDCSYMDDMDDDEWDRDEW